MDNPASSLAELLKSWDIPSGQSAMSTRTEAAGGDEAAVWRRNGEAAALLQQVVAELDAMDQIGIETSDYRAHVTRWYQAVFSYNFYWNTGMSSDTSAVQVESLQILRLLGRELATAKRYNVGGATKRAELRSCIDEAVGLIDSELDGWDGAEKEYLYRITSAARTALEQHAIHGELDLRGLLNELIGALTSIAVDIRAADGPESTRVQKLMHWVAQATCVSRGIVTDANAVAGLANNVERFVSQITTGG